MIEKIITTVCAEIGVHAERVKSKSRRKEIVAARFIICHLAYNYCGYSYRSIGTYLGQRDHTTILYAVQAIKDVLSSQYANPNLANAYHRCLRSCQPFLVQIKMPKIISLQLNKNN